MGRVSGKVAIVTGAASGSRHDKLRDIVLADMKQIHAVAGSLHGYDACFFCLGASSSGLSEARYTEVTYDLTILIASVLLEVNPDLTFIFISGAGTDSSEKGRIMWARVKGRTENALLKLPFKAAYMLRPGVIQPLHGIKSKTWQYQILYTLMTPSRRPAARRAPACC